MAGVGVEGGAGPERVDAALAEAARRRARGGPLVRLDHEPVFSAFCC